jgi:hypothetical protein
MFSCDSYNANGASGIYKKVACNQAKFKFVTLMQGDKESVYNTMECVALGHELVAVASLHAKDGNQ